MGLSERKKKRKNVFTVILTLTFRHKIEPSGKLLNPKKKIKSQKNFSKI